MAEYSKYSWTLDGDKMFVSNYHSCLLCRCWEWSKSHNHHFSQESKSLAAKVFQWNKKWMSLYLFQSEEHVCNCTFSKGSQYFSSIALNKHSRELKKTPVFYSTVPTGIIQPLVPFQESPFLSQTLLQLYSTVATNNYSFNCHISMSIILFTIIGHEQNINTSL